MHCMALQTFAVVAWFTILIIVLVLMYSYYRDRKARKTTVKEKIKSPTGKRGSDKSYTIVIKEDGSAQVLFGDGEAGERPPSGRPGASAYGGTGKVFANRNQMIKLLGGTITYDLPEIIPEENGTYALILHVWKNEVTPIEAPLNAADKKCKSCGTQNEGDSLYCKKCGKQLN